ncbi:MAG: alpha/beta hydrolase [Candidatus Bipolaricaulis sp.]|nr:alpha/beta hydrolase [Candidatus Bipolaricaulis sp.]
MNSRLSKSLTGFLAVLMVAALVLSVCALVADRRIRSDLVAFRDSLANMERQVEGSRASLDPALTARFDELTRRLGEEASERIRDVQTLTRRLDEGVAELEPDDAGSADPAQSADALTKRIDEVVAEIGQVRGAVPSLMDEVAALTQRIEGVEAELAELVRERASQGAPDPIADLLGTVSGDPIESGRFVILKSGIPLGSESFELYRSSEGLLLRSTGSASRGADWTAFAAALRTDEVFHVEGYAVRGSTRAGSLDVLVETGAGAIHVSVGAPGAMETRTLATADAVLLDDGIFAPLILLERARSDSNGADSLRAIMATRAQDVDLTLGAPETVTLATATERLAAERCGVSIEGEDEAAYYVLDGHVVGVEFPEEELFAYRSDRFPGGFLIERRSIDALALPMGIVENELPITSQGARLEGTLTYPVSGRATLPIVLLLPDLGPFDRDGNRPGLQTGILKEMARGLAQMGIASYRFDTRGTGKSEGVYGDLSLDGLLDDVRVALFVLRALPFADRAKIYAFGAGTGGTLASLLAAQGTTAGLITLGAPAYAPDRVALDEMARRAEADGLPAEDVERLLAEEQAFYRFLATTHGTWNEIAYEEVRTALPWMDEEEFARRREAVPVSLVRDLLAVDPLEVIARVKTRMLILQGDKDFQVPVEQAGFLARAASDSGNPDVELTILLSVNHLARLHSQPAASPNRHLDRHLDGQALGTIGDWLSRDLEVPAGGTGSPASST